MKFYVLILFDTLMQAYYDTFFDNYYDDYFNIYLQSYFDIYIRYLNIYNGFYSVKHDVPTMLFMLILTTVCLFAFVYYLICLLMLQFIKRIQQRI